MGKTENLKIEDADIVADLSGGRLACQEYLKRIAELKAENKQLKEKNEKLATGIKKAIDLLSKGG